MKTPRLNRQLVLEAKDQAPALNKATRPIWRLIFCFQHQLAV